jgi:WD40 repeat protein
MSRSWILLNWDRQNGTPKKPLILKDAANRMITAGAASADGRYLIVGNDYGSYIYHTADGRMSRMWDKWIFSPDFTPDGKMLFFSTYDRRVFLWDNENNPQIRQFADWGRREQLYICVPAFHNGQPDRETISGTHRYDQCAGLFPQR